MLDNEKLRDYEKEKYKEHLCCHKLGLPAGQQILLSAFGKCFGMERFGSDLLLLHNLYPALGGVCVWLQGDLPSHSGLSFLNAICTLQCRSGDFMFINVVGTVSELIRKR